MKVKLRTQFAILTVAVTLFPIVFGLLFFTGQQAKRDPREPTRIFLNEVAERWGRNRNLTIEEIRMAGEQSGLPIIDAALIAPDGTVQVSSFRELPAGIKLEVEDLVKPPLLPMGKPRPELRFLPIDTNIEESPLLLFDIQPFWSREDIRNRNFMLITSFALGAFLVAGLMSFLILRSTNRAIQNLIDDTATVASGKLDHEVKGSGAEELRSLAESINRMRITLRDMISRRMNMLIGVSHDLKTPIALIQGYTDALSDNMANDEATRIHYLEIIREKSAQLEDLVSDSSNSESNAFRYTGPGGKVEFLMHVEEGHPVLIVADNGPGIPDDELPYIFDAFYRGTHSRKEAGHGLGLTIVKSMVDLHGWSIEARNRRLSTASAGGVSAGGPRTGAVEHGLEITIRMKASA
ncbi:MAG: hypothetical protein SAMD01599839_02310 [Rectinema sp.]